jgi:hypothetical protein
MPFLLITVNFKVYGKRCFIRGKAIVILFHSSLRIFDASFVLATFAVMLFDEIDRSTMKAALAHLGERQTEVHLSPAYHAISGGTVFDPQKRQFLWFCSRDLWSFSPGSSAGAGGLDLLLVCSLKQHGSNTINHRNFLSLVSERALFYLCVCTPWHDSGRFRRNGVNVDL